MKSAVLRSIAHDIADSLASGIGLPARVHETDIFEEAAAAPEGHIAVDFLAGTTSGGHPSAGLAMAVRAYRDALEALCRRHGTTAAAFSCLTARFERKVRQDRVEVVVRDREGGGWTDTYLSPPLRRAPASDPMGRTSGTRGSGLEGAD